MFLVIITDWVSFNLRLNRKNLKIHVHFWFLQKKDNQDKEQIWCEKSSKHFEEKSWDNCLFEQDLKRNNKDISQTYKYESKVELIDSSGMTTTAAPTVKDQELLSFGLVESASVNSFADFIPSKPDESPAKTEYQPEKVKEDFKNSFICHLIFYTFLCVSIVLHILIDLGLGLFIKNKFVQLMELGKKNIFEKSPAFAWLKIENSIALT